MDLGELPGTDGLPAVAENLSVALVGPETLAQNDVAVLVATASGVTDPGTLQYMWSVLEGDATRQTVESEESSQLGLAEGETVEPVNPDCIFQWPCTTLGPVKIAVTVTDDTGRQATTEFTATVSAPDQTPSAEDEILGAAGARTRKYKFTGTVAFDFCSNSGPYYTNLVPPYFSAYGLVELRSSDGRTRGCAGLTLDPVRRGDQLTGFKSKKFTIEYTALEGTRWSLWFTGQGTAHTRSGKRRFREDGFGTAAMSAGSNTTINIGDWRNCEYLQ
jgi:hypothetical protein